MGTQLPKAGHLTDLPMRTDFPSLPSVGNRRGESETAWLHRWLPPRLSGRQMNRSRKVMTPEKVSLEVLGESGVWVPPSASAARYQLAQQQHHTRKNPGEGARLLPALLLVKQ